MKNDNTMTEQEHEEKEKHHHNQQKRKRKILLVDDDPDITLTFKLGLERNGFAVDVFNDSLIALLNFEPGIYDLLLFDIKMPEMNGFELYREIEKIDNKAKVCFVASFVAYYESLREIFPQVKIRCFIKKPIEIDNLVKRIKQELK
jgi:two-component system catabolic regulation response regulator CreB/two-component system response regulator ChvI